MPVTRERIYILLHRLTDYEIGHRPIPEQAGLDGFKGVQVKQLHRIGPLLPGEPSRLLQLLRNAPEHRLQPQVPGRDRRGVHRHSQIQTEVASLLFVKFTPSKENKFIEAYHCSNLTNHPDHFRGLT